MGFGRWYNAQKVGVQVAVVGGVLAIVGGVVAGVFGIIDVELAKPSSQPATSAPTSTRTISASAAATPSSESAVPSSPPAPAIASGTFTVPANGATNVYKHEQLRVSGTALGQSGQLLRCRRVIPGPDVGDDLWEVAGWDRPGPERVT